jgi:hypothetical protein
LPPLAYPLAKWYHSINFTLLPTAGRFHPATQDTVGMIGLYASVAQSGERVLALGRGSAEPLRALNVVGIEPQRPYLAQCSAVQKKRRERQQ